jgi:hypothetical protein
VRTAVTVAALASLATGCAGGDPDQSAVTATATATAVPDPTALVTNGVDEIGADEAVGVAREALLDATSFRVAGSPNRGTPLDLVYVSTEEVVGSTGTVTQGSSTFELRAVNSDVFVRGNLDWLAETVAEDATRTLGESWLLLPDEVAGELDVFADPQLLVDTLMVPGAPVRRVGVSLIDDAPALGVQYVDSEATVWIAGKGPLVPVLVERLGATATDGVLRISDIDDTVDLEPPPADEVVVVEREAE